MNKKAQILFWICFLSTMAAIGTHYYLTNHHYNFKYGQVASESICNVSDVVNCNRTTSSDYSEVFGVPVSILGGLMNFVFLCLLVGFRFPVVGKKTQESLASTLRLMSLGIFAVSVVMAIISYVLLKTVCPACTAAYAFSIIGFVTTWMMTSGKPLFTPFDFKFIPATMAVVMAFGFFIHHNSMRKFGGKERLEFTKLQFNDWKNYPAKNITPVSPLVMNPSSDAKIKMVEFADFLCGHCANAFPTIHAFAKSHPDVEFSFQAWPLDGECNKAIPHSEGTRCLLARVSHCAGKQNAAWKTQKWIFENQRSLMTKDSVTQGLKNKVNDLGLNEEQMMSCIDSEEAREAIRGQANLGAEIGISGTPALYINGKKVPNGFSIPLFEKIYREITQ